MSATDHADDAPETAVLATYFPDDADFRAESEPRTLPESWRADRFDTADRSATEHTGYAVLMVRGRFHGLHGDRAMIRVLYVDAQVSRTWYRDYEAIADDGYRPRRVEWSCTRSFPGAFGHAGDPVAGEEATVLARLLDQQYEGLQR